MTAICPQRIIGEAIRLLESFPLDALSDAEQEALDNNLIELLNLSRSLERAGIYNIQERNS